MTDEEHERMLPTLLRKHVKMLRRMRMIGPDAMADDVMLAADLIEELHRLRARLVRKPDPVS